LKLKYSTIQVFKYCIGNVQVFQYSIIHLSPSFLSPVSHYPHPCPLPCVNPFALTLSPSPISNLSPSTFPHSLCQPFRPRLYQTFRLQPFPLPCVNPFALTLILHQRCSSCRRVYSEVFRFFSRMVREIFANYLINSQLKEPIFLHMSILKELIQKKNSCRELKSNERYVYPVLPEIAHMYF